MDSRFSLRPPLNGDLFIEIDDGGYKVIDYSCQSTSGLDDLK